MHGGYHPNRRALATHEVIHSGYPQCGLSYNCVFPQVSAEAAFHYFQRVATMSPANMNPKPMATFQAPRSSMKPIEPDAT